VFWQISLHSSGVNFFLSAVSHAKEAGRPMLRTSRTHKAAAAATFEAVEPAAEAMTTDMVERGRTTQCKERDIYIAS